MSGMRKAARWAWANFEPMLAMILTAAFVVVDLFFSLDQSTLLTAVVGVLLLIAAGQMRDRSARGGLSSAVSALNSRLNTPANPDLSLVYGTHETQALSGARKSLLIVQETGALLVERDRHHLMELLKAGGEVSITVVDPAGQAFRTLAMRNHNIGHRQLVSRADAFDAQIAHIRTEVGKHADRLSVRKIAYPVEATGVIVDAGSDRLTDRIALYRIAGFDIDYKDKPALLVNAESSPTTYEFVAAQFTQLHRTAPKVVLLVGPPHSGKSNLIRRIAEAYRDEPGFAWVATTERLEESGERAGFDLEASWLSSSLTLISKGDDGNYEIEPEIWRSVLREAHQQLDSGSLILFDEVGPLQLAVPETSDLLRRLESDGATNAILTTSDASLSAVAELARSPRSTILDMVPRRDEGALEAHLSAEVATTLSWLARRAENPGEL